MIHGDCSSSGCYAMTDEQISEIYSLARDSLIGRPSFQVQAYPFRRDAGEPGAASKSSGAWRSGRCSRSATITSLRRVEPRVDVCNRRYVFDAQPPPNSPSPLVFNPTGKRPDFVVNPKIARPALEKQRADELEYAQLLEDDVPTAPIYSGLDGGMNAFFLPWYPGRVTLSQVLPYASYLPHLPTDPLGRQRWFVDEQIVWHLVLIEHLVCRHWRCGTHGRADCPTLRSAAHS